MFLIDILRLFFSPIAYKNTSTFFYVFLFDFNIRIYSIENFLQLKNMFLVKQLRDMIIS